eukprot:TRINITY_DN3682_c0_g1_i1.p1 TRINITY_DN3682_c0_g1~~TRINITY_DN3682_c0_g1_i1.p1  ORF type:complete len:212 (+),score=39.22 TRINITY_DN3682_c0_g1_i1:175-810(+)
MADSYKGIRFCSECSNIMYPQEEDRTLVFKCKTCKNTETVKDRENAEENLISRKEVKTQGNKDVLNSEFAKEYVLDPSMFRANNVRCPNCDHNEAVYSISRDDEAKKLKLLYICARVDETNFPICGRTWYSDETGEYQIMCQTLLDVDVIFRARCSSIKSRTSMLFLKNEMYKVIWAWPLGQSIDDSVSLSCTVHFILLTDEISGWQFLQL